jgi:hypothetical protein
LERYVAVPVYVNHEKYLANYLIERGHADLVPLIHTRLR